MSDSPSPWKAICAEHELPQRIDYRLFKEATAFPVLYGIAANAAFLGKVEMEEFERVFDEYSVLMKTETGGSGKHATFCGMEIFPVDEPSHFSVGLTHPIEL